MKSTPGEQSPGLGSREAAHPDIAGAVIVRGVLLNLICQEELYDPGREVSIN